jgi:hypothetical protein
VQAAIVEPQRIRLLSATCPLPNATSDVGSLKLIAECADIISYTSRIVYVKLRADDELVYSPTGDPVLATNLRKCSLWQRRSKVNTECVVAGSGAISVIALS